MGDPSPDNVIDLTLDDYEDDTVVWNLHSVRKRIRSSVPSAIKKKFKRIRTSVPPGIKKIKIQGSRRKKVKSEPFPSMALDNDDGEIEILDQLPLDETTIISPAAAASLNSSSNNKKETDEDIALVGTRNHQRLPHARQHCTEKPFQNDTGYSLAARQAVNSQVCDLCFCFVCDVPAKDCKGDWEKDHCLATDQGHQKAYWAKRRAKVQKKGSQAAAAVAAASSATSAASTGVRHSRHECPHHAFEKTNDEDYDSDDSYMSVPEPSSDTNKHHCPACYCFICEKPASECPDWKNPGFLGAYTYYAAHCNAHPDDGVWEDKRRQTLLQIFGPGPFAPDHQAVEVDKSLTKCRHCKWYSRPCTAPYSRHFVHVNDDLCRACGRIAVTMANLGNNQGTSYKPKPDDIFLGTRKVTFSLCQVDPREVEKYAARWKDNAGQPGWIYNEKTHTRDVFQHRLGSRPTLGHILALMVRDATKENINTFGAAAYKSNIVQLENQWDLVMMEELKNTAGTSFGQQRHGWIYGEIEASWDSAKSSGVFEIRVYVKPDAKAQDQSVGFAGFLGCWFGVLPFKLSDCSINLRAKVNDDLEDRIHVSGVPVEGRQKGDTKKVKQFNAAVHASRKHVSLQSGTGSNLLGGTSVSSVDATSFPATLKRYFEEILPECVARDLAHGETPSGFTFDSFLTPEDYKMALLTAQDVSKWRRQTASLKGLMDNLENRGHAAAPFVEGLNVELLPFQSQILQWALEREAFPGGIQSFFWTKLPGLEPPVYYNPVIGRLSLSKPNLVRGGFISSAMGLGKTVISLALVLQNTAPTLPSSGSHVSSISTHQNPAPGAPFRDPDLYQRTSKDNEKRGSIASRGTLVVCTKTLVGQWVAEAKAKIKNPGMVYTYYGQGRNRDPVALSQAAIVVTTYETLASDATFHARKSNDPDYIAPCEAIRWWRVFADEGHQCRYSNNGKSLALMKIVADNKWMVSGTPVNTTVMDLRNQFKFLGIDVLAEMETFKSSFFRQIGDPSTSKSTTTRELPGIGLFNFFMRNLLIRHSQSQKYSGTNTTLMSLPPKTERVTTVKFSTQEKKEYAMLEESARMYYEKFVSSGKDIGRNYLRLTRKIEPMRVACAGGRIPLEDTDANDVDDDASNSSDMPKKVKKVRKFSDFAFTSKLKKLIAELQKVRTNDSTSKCLVFSQYTSTLKWLQEELPNHGFQYRTISGDMSMAGRAKALRDFQNDPPTTIFLLSMRAGAVGINLTQANHIFLMEPVFNPALEAQAIGRVHRLGQKRAVTITHLVTKKSIETRIRKMLEKKYGTASATAVLDGGNDVDDDKKPAEDGSDDEDKKPAATPAAVVGCLSTDKAKIMADEFDLLFGVKSKRSAASAVPDNVGSFAPGSVGSYNEDEEMDSAWL